MFKCKAPALQDCSFKPSCCKYPEGRAGRSAQSLGVPSFLEYIDVFGGAASISGVEKGFNFERRVDKQYNIHEASGLLLLAKKMVILKPHGLITFQPTCASWLPFLSAKTSGRCKADRKGHLTCSDDVCGS